MTSSEPDQGRDSMVVIRVDGNCIPAAVYFKIRRTTPMRKMMEAYCMRCAQTLDCCRFYFNQTVIQPEQTAEQLDMQEGSKVSCTITSDTAESLAVLAKKAKPTRVDSSKLIVENHGLYECIICAHVYWPPVLCEGGHTLCQSCAKKLHDRDQPCPMRCNTKFSSKPPQNFELKRVVERLKASCTAPSCRWKGTLAQFVEVHEKRCDQIMVSCPKSSSCPWTGLRGQVLAHLQMDCGKVVNKCQKCQKVFHRDEWAKHLDESKECAAATSGGDFLNAGSCSCHQMVRQLEVKFQARLDALERRQLLAGYLSDGGQRAMALAQSSQTRDGEAGGRVGESGYGDGESGSAEGELLTLLQGAGLGSIASRLCEEIGLVESTDLGLLQVEDVQTEWLKPVQRRKLLALGDRVRQQQMVEQRPKYLHSRGSSSVSTHVDDVREGERSAFCGSLVSSPASLISGRRDAPEKGESCNFDKEEDSEADGYSNTPARHGLDGAGSGSASGGKRKRAT